MASPSNSNHVVIVGAGLSGLTAADELLRSRAGSGALRVTVLEASERVGGRTCAATLKCCDVQIDAGGQWLGAKQHEVIKLAERLGLIRQPQYVAGKKVIQIGPTIASYRGHIPSLSIAQLLDAQCAIVFISLLQWLLWLLPSGLTTSLSSWADRITVGQLANRLMWTQGGRALLRIVVQALFGAEPEGISVLALTRYVSASGTLEEMTEMGPGSVQAWTLLGGAQQLSDGLAASVSAAGGSIQFAKRVVSVRRLPAIENEHGCCVEVCCDDGSVHPASHVIVALPPPIARAIAFSPPLPDHRLALLRESAMGSIIKCHVVYRSAFWRAAGFSGEVVCDVTSDPHGGPAFNIFDGCVPVPTGPTSPTVSAFHADAASPAIGSPSPGGLHIHTPLEVEWAQPSGLEDSIILPTAPASASGRKSHAASSVASVKYLPCLVVFINADKAQQWAGASQAQQRREAVLRQLARYFGPAALDPLEYCDKDWAIDPFTKGCPIASYGAGVLGRYGLARQLSEPCWPDSDLVQSTSSSAGGSSVKTANGDIPTPIVHRLHWAGTETSDCSTGFMDGAIRAGHRVAAEVARALSVADTTHSASTKLQLPRHSRATASSSSRAAHSSLGSASVTENDSPSVAPAIATAQAGGGGPTLLTLAEPLL